jgi:hypothetical protein
LKVAIRPACFGEEFLQGLLRECPGGHECGHAQDCWQERRNVALKSQNTAFLTMSVIARSSMEHGVCIDCAEAIGPAASPGEELTRSIWSKGNFVMIERSVDDRSLKRNRNVGTSLAGGLESACRGWAAHRMV